jgi:hypothetical protein
MKRIGIIAIFVWVAVLVLVVIHAAWAHHSVQASAAHYTTPTSKIHMVMLISEGSDALLAAGALVASLFLLRSTRRAPSIALTVIAMLALLEWSVSFAASLQHTDRTFFALRPLTGMHIVLFWHAYLDTALRCLLAGVGLVCGIIGITKNRRNPDAEQPAAQLQTEGAPSV